jgi:RNA polymerase sigma-70 factor, ECF subfamily
VGKDGGAARGRAYHTGVDELSRLALAARRGEPGALEAFIGDGYEHVRRLCAGLVDDQSAADLTQETFVRAVSGLRRYRADAPALTWLLAVARHTCMDELRRRISQRRRDGLICAEHDRTSASPDPAGEVSVRDLIGRLDPDRRAAFVLTQLLHMPYDQAAHVCGCPPGTIRSRVARARDDLIGMLAASQPGLPRRRRA